MPLSAVLLVGGKSSRMGCDKAFLDCDGKPLWQHQLDVLRELSPDQILISGPSRKEWENYELVSDEIENAGPLAGVAAALDRCRSRLLIVLAIDLARMTSDYLRSLLDWSSIETGVIPVSPRGFEPLAAIYPQRCRPLAAACLRGGDFSMQNFVRQSCAAGFLRLRSVASDETDLFTNLNTLADYEKTLSRAADQSR